MRIRYASLFIALLVTAALWPGQSRAQSPLVVEWADPATGEVQVNALRDAILNDTDRPDDRVYVLERGGFYWNTDRISWDGYHLRIVGQTADEADQETFVCGPNQDEDCGPAIIQRVAYEDGGAPDGQMFNNAGTGSHLTLKNVWVMGQTDQGGLTAYEPFTLNAADSDYIIDNVIFDRNDWHHLGPNAADTDWWVTNSVFRNLFGPSQIWEGLGIRFEVGADTVVFENNTFLNIGFTPFQSEAEPIEYFRVNHNTFVNVGRGFSAGSIWKEAYITNNLFVNPYWHGSSEEMYSDPEADDPFASFFSIAPLPARFGTEFDRRVVVANNAYWRDPAFETFYAAQDPYIRSEPFINDTTAGWFEAYESMVFEDNYIGVNPELTVYPTDDIIDQMTHNIVELYGANSVERGDMYYWDPGREEDCFVCNVWPLPEDFSYSNATLLDGGTDGLPVGDLNWFPDAKDDFLANHEQYVMEIESMAGDRIVLEPVGLTQAEEGALEGDATVESVEGFTHYFMQGGGFIEWTFEIEEAGTYGLNVNTNMRAETQRGQRIILNGTNLRNNAGFGEYYFCTAAIDGCAVPLPNDEFVDVEVRAANLVEGADALTLDAGTHTVRIEPSWGWQGFSGVDIVDEAGNVVVDLEAPDAVAEGVEEICEDAGYCPQGFSAVALGAGGSASWTFDAPVDGDYMLRIFYQADAATSAQLSQNGSVLDDDVALPATEVEGGDVFTDQFALSAGARTLTLSTDQGGVLIDYVQLISIGGTSGTDKDELPEGYALDQNYPNPFNPTTTIEYQLGATGHVTLTVYDVLGRQVRTLVDGTLGAGVHVARFDGSGLSSGVYFYHLETPVGQRVRSMMLVK